MRRKVQPNETARARARVVFPIPGTSSSSRCPSVSTATRVRLIVARVHEVKKPIVSLEEKKTSQKAAQVVYGPLSRS